MKEKFQNVETKRILIYIGSTFLLTWIYCLAVIYPMMRGETLSGVPAVMTQFLVAAAMFFPAIGVLITRLVTKEGFKNVWIRPNIKGNIRTYLLAYFGPGVLTILGTILYFVIFWGRECAAVSWVCATAGVNCSFSSII